MATNEIEIKLSVSGSQQAERQIDKVEKASVNLGQSAKGVGETFSSVGEAIDKSGGLMGAGFSAIGDSVMAVTEGVSGMSDAFSVAATSGGKAWVTLLGPAALLVTAIGAAIEAFREFSGAAREAEMWEEAMSATASDLTSRMETLAESGIKVSTAELKGFIEVNQQARLTLELLGLKNETLVKKYQERKKWSDLVSKAEKQQADETANANKQTTLLGTAADSIVDIYTDMKSIFVNVDKSVVDLNIAKDNLAKINEKVAESERELALLYEKEVIPQLRAAQKAQEIASKTQLQLDDDLYAKLKELESIELERLDLQGKSRQAIEKVGSATKALTVEQDRRRKKELELQRQLKDNIITQEQYDMAMIKEKGITYDLIKAIDEKIQAVSRNNRALQDADDKKKRIEGMASDREEKAFNRRIELLNRQKDIQSSMITQESINASRKRNTILREIADLKILTQEEEGRASNLAKALGVQLRQSEREKKGREQLQQDLKDIDKKILDEQLAYALKTEAKLNVDMNKLSNNALKYLDDLLKKSKKGNKQALATIVEDFRYHYEKLDGQSERAISEQIISEMESASSRSRIAKDFLLAREK